MTGGGDGRRGDERRGGDGEGPSSSQRREDMFMAVQRQDKRYISDASFIKDTRGPGVVVSITDYRSEYYYYYYYIILYFTFCSSRHCGPSHSVDDDASTVTSAPHPYPFVMFLLQPHMTVSRSSIHSSPVSRRASHRRDAFGGFVQLVSPCDKQNTILCSPVVLR